MELAQAFTCWAFADSAVFRQIMRIIEQVQRNQLSGMVEKIDLEILVPSDFPEKYSDSLTQNVNHHKENQELCDFVTDRIH